MPRLLATGMSKRWAGGGSTTAATSHEPNHLIDGIEPLISAKCAARSFPDTDDAKQLHSLAQDSVIGHPKRVNGSWSTWLYGRASTCFDASQAGVASSPWAGKNRHRERAVDNTAAPRWRRAIHGAIHCASRASGEPSEFSGGAVLSISTRAVHSLIENRIVAIDSWSIGRAAGSGQVATAVMPGPEVG